MLEPTFSESFILERAKESVNVNYVNVAAVTFLAYDALLSLDDEIKYVWRSKWTFVKIVYIASKYLAFVDGTMILLVFLNPSLGLSACSTIYTASTYIILVGIALAELILLIRTCALWGLSRYVLWYLIAFDVGSAVLAVVKLSSSFQDDNFICEYDLISYTELTSNCLFTVVPSPIPNIRNCFPIFGDKADGAYVDFLCVMAAELNVLVLTLWRGVMHWRRHSSRLVHIFYRDGIVYLVSLVVISATNVVFFVIDDSNYYYNVMLEPQRIAHAVLSAHLILNVREIGAQNGRMGYSQAGSASVSEPVSLQMKTMASTLTRTIDTEV
ncbi:hypothetical protein SCHPADRAFT_193377 [Schizopora paradoxa]|uniref:DUF6533 domain-containing protein n=1 Tax=Schizopora paradoxa TaxID=27342 RepID=A0A0H2S564_9AGAM|nr:hypothetical protein SCHPADRAFT_193377 [Schizopora paradoxa]